MKATDAAVHLSALIDITRAELGSLLEIPADEFEYLPSVAAFSEIVLVHAEALRALATSEERFYFAGASCARSAFEAAVIAAWICVPKEKNRKEGRWLGYQETMAAFHRNQASGLADVDPTLDESAAPLRAIQELLKSRKINGEAIPLETKPSTETMLKDMGFHEVYPAYRELCEVIHIGPEMLMRFKEGLNSETGGKIRITHRMLETEWVVPFLTISWSIVTSAMAILGEFGSDSSTLRRIHAARIALDACVRSG